MNDTDSLIGQQLGEILVQEPLGRGGMARVYKGLDTSLRRPVAIKVIAEGLRDSHAYAQRFEREAQAVANLKHPNIVTVFRFGKTGTLFYLVMEFVDGVDLDAILRNYEQNGELMPHDDVIRILEAIASALDYAHGQGVIHRDVKPSNIMLERDGRPVLTDFGLALRLSEGTIGDTFGSPHYIAPEQARSSANAVAQSDLYSLGVVAYELLTGVVPFDDPSPAAIAVQHLTTEVPSPRALNRNLSEEVEQVLLTALAKEPEDRYPTCGAFIETLKAAIIALKQHPVSVRTSDLPPLPAGMTPPPPRRLSMQTAQDKLEQELTITHARGQANTRLAQKRNVQAYRASPSATSSGGRRTLFIAGEAALVILIVAGIALSKILNSNGASAIPTLAILPTSASATPLQRIPTYPPTTQLLTPTQRVAIAATVPARSTLSVQPTLTPLPATTAVPSTPVSASAIPASAAPSDATNGAGGLTPTVLYPSGRPFVLLWDDVTLYGANQGQDNVLISSLALERVLNNGGFGQRYEGKRWGAYYPYVEVKKCVILRTGRNYTLPPECPYGINANILPLPEEQFWTPAPDSVAFRVLWNNREIARCQIADRRCLVLLPPK
ncbi:MAG TPA: serine/threonine-protein kinase [Aggregatilineales bacterium]|nr:serine/threonine-protein kinase [Aggregatilineales bacterium]